MRAAAIAHARATFDATANFNRLIDALRDVAIAGARGGAAGGAPRERATA